MYRVLVWTSKGGSGKTTTVANTAPELARLGYNVLIVGFDPQGDLESTFGVDENTPELTRIEDLLRGGGDPAGAAVEISVQPLARRLRRGPPSEPGKLQLLPCSSRLLEHSTEAIRRGYQDLDQILTAFEDRADIALIDTQGALTPLSQTAAHAADGVLFVGEPGYYEFRALSSRLEDLERLREQEGLDIAPIGLLFVRTSLRSRQMREYRDHLQDPEALAGDPLYVFKAHTRQQASVRDHPRLQQPTALADPDSHVAQDYRAFAQELVERLAAIARPQATPA